MVAADGSGSHKTIQAALNEEIADALIELRPGVYKEPLLIRQSVTIRGTNEDDADRGFCRIVSSGETTIAVDLVGAGVVRLANLTIDSRLGNVGTQAAPAMNLTRGTVVLDNCKVTAARSPAAAFVASIAFWCQELRVC